MEFLLWSKKKVSLENCPWNPPTIKISLSFTWHTPDPCLGLRRAIFCTGSRVHFIFREDEMSDGLNSTLSIELRYFLVSLEMPQKI